MKNYSFGWIFCRPEFFYNDGVESLEKCQTKCIEVKGDYIEKY